MTDNFYVPIRTIEFNNRFLITVGIPVLVDGIFIGYTDLHVVSHEEYHAKYRSSSDKMKKLVR